MASSYHLSLCHPSECTQWSCRTHNPWMPRKPFICHLPPKALCLCLLMREEGVGGRRKGHNQMAISWWECPTNGELNMECVCFIRYQDHMMGLFCPWSLVGRWLKWSRICLECRRCGFSPQVRKIPLEKGLTTCSSFLAWRIPWTEETGGLQSTGLQRVRHHWATGQQTNTEKKKDREDFKLVRNTNCNGIFKAFEKCPYLGFIKRRILVKVNTSALN